MLSRSGVRGIFHRTPCPQYLPMHKSGMGTDTPLHAGEALRSQDGRFEFAMQKDGNLALYVRTRVVALHVHVLCVTGAYSSGSSSPPPPTCRYRENKDGTRTRIWQTRTSGIGHRIKLGTFGQLKMTNRNGVKKWSTGALQIGLSPKLTVKNNGRVEIGRSQP